MRKNISLIILLVILNLVMVHQAGAVDPLKFVTVRFADGSTLNCRVGAEEGTLLTPDAGAPDQVLSCEEGYDLSQIVWIRVNARQVGLNPYLGLTQFVPADINQVLVPDGQIGG